MQKNNNITSFCLSFILLFLVSCGSRIWINDDNNANFDRDYARCQAYASGNAPMPKLQSLETAQNFSGSAMVNGQTYLYSGTIYPDANKNLQTSLNNLSASIDAWMEKALLYEQCMHSLGWREADELEKDKLQASD